MSDTPERTAASDKVVPLFGGDTTHITGEPNPETIKVLEHALEYAKSGELLSVAISGALRCGSLLNLDAGTGQGTTWQLLSAMELALFNFKTALQSVHEALDD